jgi:hypothetical protein
MNTYTPYMANKHIPTHTYTSTSKPVSINACSITPVDPSVSVGPPSLDICSCRIIAGPVWSSLRGPCLWPRQVSRDTSQALCGGSSGLHRINSISPFSSSLYHLLHCTIQPSLYCTLWFYSSISVIYTLQRSFLKQITV